ncbi:MAG TPA: tripartite tricarboxylate transporter substrate-binding protein [Candidatus Binatia bacterium]|jgi:tripartite-type tricarboxylate transporter receptor subunit TctC|nr:tripartite tricarboxylate transporter substrate-binding protein [Candidatus Binatia bacterium]
MKRTNFSAFFLFGFALLSSIAHATSHEFFKDKTVRLVVGTSAGGAQDEWARFIAPHLGRNIPGGPEIVVQNMPGAGTVIAANYIYNIAKPDGLTIGLVNPAIYVDQLLGAKEVKFDWPKLSWIGSPERIDQVLFIRTDFPQKTLDDLRKAPEPPRCAATGRSGAGYFLPRLLEEGLGIKIQMVVGYGGGGDMNLAMEKGEVQCRAGTVSAYVGREPTRTWAANGFTRALVQSGTKRYAKLPDVPTLYELMETYKTPDATKRVAKVLLSSGDLGRPFFGPPGMAADRVKVLREAFTKTMNDEALLAEAKKKKWDLDPMGGEELEKLAKEIMVQPPEVIERVKKIQGN